MSVYLCKVESVGIEDKLGEEDVKQCIKYFSNECARLTYVGVNLNKALALDALEAEGDFVYLFGNGCVLLQDNITPGDKTS